VLVILHKNVEPMFGPVNFDHDNAVVNAWLEVGLFHEEIKVWAVTGPVLLRVYAPCDGLRRR